MPEIIQDLQNLISKYSFWQKSLKPKDDVKTLHVDEVASKVAAFYEQIRTIIDWKEEHLMRRAAIIRKIKRKFIDIELNDFSSENIAEPLILELIRGGYFPNDKIEETKLQEVQNIIDKYIFILKNNPGIKKGKAGLLFYNKILEVAACEIEETLAPSIKEMALIDYMFSVMRERIKVQDSLYQRGLLRENEKDILIYIGVQQALFKLDEPIISYNLLKYKYPFWDNPSEEELFKISQNIIKIIDNIEDNLSHPLLRKFYSVCERYDTPYLLLSDILTSGKPEEITEKIKDPKSLEQLAKDAYKNRFADLKAKIARAATYSISSIFITKILSLLILELILAKLTNDDLHLVFLVADILIPTFLMTFLVLTVKSPSDNNLNIAVLETMKAVYKKEKPEVYEIKASRKRSVAVRTILSFIYATGSVISFGVIFLIFNYFAFPLTSIIINFIFIALILFAGTAIQKRANELTMEEEREGVLEFVSDVLFLPITEIGRWLSNTWKQYNAIAAFFNALIDMPFSAFIEFLERWRYFIKEKKEDLK